MIFRIIRKIVRYFGFELAIYPKEAGLKWLKPSSLVQTNYEVDSDFLELYIEGQEKTNMQYSDNPLRRQRHYTLNYLLWTTKGIKGDVGEAGCFKGLSSYQIASFLKSDSKKSFFIFDSFEGLSEINDLDRPKDRKQIDEEVRKRFAANEDDVRESLSSFDNISIFKGWIPDRYPEIEDKKFSFVHIDVDLYDPIMDSLRFFYPRTVDKGIIVFDDYGCSHFPGAKMAVDDFIKSLNEDVFFVPMPSGQAFLIKKYYE
jgi:O-methyltransferase